MDKPKISTFPILKMGEGETMEFGRIGSYRDIKPFAEKHPYAGLSNLDVYNWAAKPANLSREYHAGRTVSASMFKEGKALISDVMLDLDSMFLHEYSDYNREYLFGGFRDHFHKKLEDPGYLYHVVFFDVANDPEAISFEWHAFHGHDTACCGLLHGHSFDLSGRPRPIREDSPWHFMISIEGAIVGERKIVTELKPKDIDVVLDFNIENDSLRHLEVMDWPTIISHHETFQSSNEAIARAERIVSEMNRDEYRRGIIYFIDHIEIVSVGIWGITNIRAFIKKDQRGDPCVRDQTDGLPVN